MSIFSECQAIEKCPVSSTSEQQPIRLTDTVEKWTAQPVNQQAELKPLNRRWNSNDILPPHAAPQTIPRFSSEAQKAHKHASKKTPRDENAEPRIWGIVTDRTIMVMLITIAAIVIAFMSFLFAEFNKGTYDKTTALYQTAVDEASVAS